MLVLKEYRICEGFHGDSCEIVIDIPRDAKLVEAYAKGSTIYIMAAIDPSESWLVKTKFQLFKVGAKLPFVDELKDLNFYGLVQFNGLSPIVVLECPMEEVSMGIDNKA